MDPLRPTSRPGPALEPATPPSRGHPLALFAAMLLVYLGPGAVAQLSSRIVGLAWIQVFAFLLPAAAFAAASNLVPARLLRIDRPAPRWTVLLGVGMGVAGGIAASALATLVLPALPRSVVQQFDVLSRLFEGSRSTRVALALVAVVVAPTCEELAFRGHLLSVLGARLRPTAAIAASAGLFAVMHFDPVRFAAVLALGLLYGWITWRAGSLWPSIAAHAATNAIGTLLTLSASAPSLDEARQRPLDSLLWLGVGAALLVPLVALFRRLTPGPPPFETALSPVDPADRDPRLRLHRVPGPMLVAAVLGVALVVVLATVRRAAAG